jgi:hypothetical protein
VTCVCQVLHELNEFLDPSPAATTKYPFDEPGILKTFVYCWKNLFLWLILHDK